MNQVSALPLTAPAYIQESSTPQTPRSVASAAALATSSGFSINFMPPLTPRLIGAPPMAYSTVLFIPSATGSFLAHDPSAYEPTSVVTTPRPTLAPVPASLPGTSNSLVDSFVTNCVSLSNKGELGYGGSEYKWFGSEGWRSGHPTGMRAFEHREFVPDSPLAEDRSYKDDGDCHEPVTANDEVVGSKAKPSRSAKGSRGLFSCFGA